MAKSDRETDRK